MYSALPLHRRRLGTLASVLALLCIAFTAAEAQRFQHLYCNIPFVAATAGFSGVKQLGDGGYIMVGYYSLYAPTSSAYIVRTWPDGSVRWTQSYNIGNADSATDVAVVVDPVTGDTTFVVCGVTNNNAGMCPADRNAFLLKVDNAGVYIAHNTFGSPTDDEIFTNLLQTRWPWQGAFGANAGDFVAVGSSTYNAGGGRDGFIVRADAALNLIWGEHYGGPNSKDEYFNGVEELLASNPNLNGAIVAVGATNTTGAGKYDVLSVEVMGSLPAIVASATYGLPNDEEAHAVIQIRSGPSTGHLAIAGNSLSRPFPSTNSEALMIETLDNPCRLVADQFAGDNGPDEDGALDLKEDEFDCPNGNDLIVTGYTSFGTAAMVAPNVFLQSFITGSLSPSGGAMAYGGDGDDRGWSVDNALNPAGTGTQGYAICGYTESPSFIGSVVRRMYLIKTDARYTNSCNQYAFDFSARPAGLRINCFQMAHDQLTTTCISWLSYWSDPSEIPLCYTMPRTRRPDAPNDGAAGAEHRPAPDLSAVAVSGFPNPVARDGEFQLRIDTPSPATARVSVFDVAGRQVHDAEFPVAAGSTQHGIDTRGWPAGAYVLRVRMGNGSWGSRMVVVDK
jgi:hypothetical protein